MPLYEYQCDNCGSRFEVIQKFSDPPVAACTTCGGPVKKLLSSPAIQFKGSGWYVTDYARKGSSGATAAPATGSTAEGKSSPDTTASSPSPNPSTNPSGTTS